jgi:hypothetical protein
MYGTREKSRHARLPIALTSERNPPLVHWGTATRNACSRVQILPLLLQRRHRLQAQGFR